MQHGPDLRLGRDECETKISGDVYAASGCAFIASCFFRRRCSTPMTPNPLANSIR
jgi:hypothetical protein